MNMAMLQQIAQTKSHHQVHLQGTEIPILMQDADIDLHLAMIIETDIDLTGQDPTPAVIDTGVTVRVIHKGVAPGHITDAHTEAHNATDTQAHITIDKTLHIEDLHHTEVFPHIPEIIVDLDHYLAQNTCITFSKPSYSSNRTAWKNKDSKYKQVTIDDPPSEYYSSDEPSSESDEDLN